MKSMSTAGVSWPVVAATGIWLALLAAAGELGLLAFQTWGLGRFVHHAGPHMLWMVPVSNVLVLALPTLLVAGAHHRWPGLITPRAALGTLTFLAVFGVLLLGRRQVHVAALAMVAAAIAVQGSAIAVRRADLFRSMLRRTLPPMVGLTLAAAVLVTAAPGWIERRQTALLPAAPPAAPNVILLILDTVRDKSLTLDGYTLPTSPRLEALGESGVVFSQALAPSNWTPPSHASIFTGHYAIRFPRVGPQSLDDRDPTLAEVLAARGYATAGFSANRIINRLSGLTRGFAHFESYASGLDQILHTGAFGQELLRSAWYRRLTGHQDMAGRLGADDINARLFRWYDRHVDGRPFFAFLNYFEAHAPYLPPEPYDTLFGARRRGEPALRELLTAADVDTATLRAELGAYEGAIGYADAQIGALADSLRERGLLENTILIIGSDHGEEFGEHGGMGHGGTLYREVTEVPLVIVAPGRVPAGYTIETPVTLADLPATIADLAGLAEHPFPGGSLRALWSEGTGEVAGPRPAIAAWRDRMAVAIGRYRFLRTDGGSEELYDLTIDPVEQNNIVSDTSLATLVDRARALLDEALH